MPERVKLQEPGSELVMTVSKVTPETVENIEYFLFANGQKELLVPVSSVRSQLERLNVEVATDIAGKTVRFSRSAKLSKFGKPFWNLDLATEAERSQSAPGTIVSAASTAAAPVAEPEKPKLMQVYLDATEFILNKIVPLYEAKEIGVSDTACAAMVATLVIQAGKER